MASEDASHATAPIPTHGALEERRLPRDETDAWIDGSIAGITGAAVVALYFLALDLAQGVPLRTPGLLGTALFLGRSLPPDSAASIAVVAGYTVVHGVLFVAAGVCAGFALIRRSRPLGPLSGLGLAAALFAGMEILFLATLLLAAPQLIGQFGIGKIATANALAAGAMAAALLRRHYPVGPKFGARVTVGVLAVFVLSVAFLVHYCASAYVAIEQ
jgi:hypothetical protein